ASTADPTRPRALRSSIPASAEAQWIRADVRRRRGPRHMTADRRSRRRGAIAVGVASLLLLTMVAWAPAAWAAVPNLTINDVSHNEGNAGTTSFSFTVSLSAAAGPGGVTFDIATAAGTASAPSDYVTQTLTGQTIAQSSSTYTFTVLVNGDTTPEADETFVVNVTNVAGATTADGQGQGTIVNDDVVRIHD